MIKLTDKRWYDFQNGVKIPIERQEEMILETIKSAIAFFNQKKKKKTFYYILATGDTQVVSFFRKSKDNTFKVIIMISTSSGYKEFNDDKFTLFDKEYLK